MKYNNFKVQLLNAKHVIIFMLKAMVIIRVKKRLSTIYVSPSTV